mgnify:CR=1 FL=1
MHRLTPTKHQGHMRSETTSTTTFIALVCGPSRVLRAFVRRNFWMLNGVLKCAPAACRNFTIVSTANLDAHTSTYTTGWCQTNSSEYAHAAPPVAAQLAEHVYTATVPQSSESGLAPPAASALAAATRVSRSPSSASSEQSSCGIS